MLGLHVIDVNSRLLPIRILYTIPNFITAGSGRVMLNTIERLDRHLFSPTVCVARRGGSLDAEVEGLGIPLLELPFAVPAYPRATLPLRILDAARPFREQRYGIWHSFHYSDDYTEPLIARAAGAKNWAYTKKAMGWGSRGWLVRSYLASAIIADNSEMPQLMFDRWGLRSKVSVVHHGISTTEFSPGDASLGGGYRERLRLPFDAFVIGCVAHLVPVKGHPTLIQAAARVPQCHLVLAGRAQDEEYVRGLRRLVSELNMEARVHFLGGIDDVPSLLKELDVIVLPTWARWRMEGCPVALIEAMSCARCCVATDIPGVRDIIEAGKSGVIVQPEDVDELAGALIALKADPALRRSLGANARSRVVKRFHADREAAGVMEVYRRLTIG